MGMAWVPTTPARSQGYGGRSILVNSRQQGQVPWGVWWLDLILGRAHFYIFLLRARWLHPCMACPWIQWDPLGFRTWGRIWTSGVHPWACQCPMWLVEFWKCGSTVNPGTCGLCKAIGTLRHHWPCKFMQIWQVLYILQVQDHPIFGAILSQFRFVLKTVCFSKSKLQDLASMMTGSTFASPEWYHNVSQKCMTCEVLLFLSFDGYLDVHSISKAVNNPDNKQGYSATILVPPNMESSASCAGCMLPFRPWWKGRLQPLREICLVLLLMFGDWRGWDGSSQVTSELHVDWVSYDSMAWRLKATGCYRLIGWSWDNPDAGRMVQYLPGGTIAPTCRDLSRRCRSGNLPWLTMLQHAPINCGDRAKAMSRLSAVLPTGDWWSGCLIGGAKEIQRIWGYWCQSQLVSSRDEMMKWMSMGRYGKPKSQDFSWFFFSADSFGGHTERIFGGVVFYAAVLWQVNLTALQKHSLMAGGFKKDSKGISWVNDVTRVVEDFIGCRVTWRYVTARNKQELPVLHLTFDVWSAAQVEFLQGRWICGCT